MISNNKFDFWIQNDLNVLLAGRHGVGKSSMVIDAFERNGLKWKYFSAATMDPWVDFIGVPKEKHNSDGTSHLDLIRPLDFQNDDVEAIFFDELNRAHKKVRNAVMELIQFKSINGKKFENLKIIWAAINPDDDEEEEYDVEKLDPAQKDRFHIQVEIPYKPDKSFFKSKYGNVVGPAAIEWWDALPEDTKNAISPRRLDYAIEIHKKNGDLRDVLPSKSNISKLITMIKTGPIKDEVYKIFNSKNKKEAEEFLSDENNFSCALEIFMKDQKLLNFFVPQFPKQKLASALCDKKKNNPIRDMVLNNFHKEKKFGEVVKEVYTAGANDLAISAIDNAAFKSGAQYKFLHGKSILEGVSINKSAKYVPTLKGSPNNWQQHFEYRFNKVYKPGYYGSTQSRGSLLAFLGEGIDDSKINDSRLEELTQVLNKIGASCHQKTFTGKTHKNTFGVFIPVVNKVIEMHLRRGKIFSWQNNLGILCAVKDKINAKNDDLAIPITK